MNQLDPRLTNNPLGWVLAVAITHLLKDSDLFAKTASRQSRAVLSDLSRPKKLEGTPPIDLCQTTRSGRAVIKEFEEFMKKIQDDALVTLTSDEQATLIQLLKKLHAGFSL